MNGLRTSALASWFALLIVGACQTAPSAGPGLGEEPLPATILILPPSDGAGGGSVHRDAAIALMVASEQALLARGYLPVPAEVGAAILEGRGYSLEVPVPTDDAGLLVVSSAAAGLAVDACLAIEVRNWETFWSAGLEAVDYDVRFRLVDANHGQVLFEYEKSASWSWAGRHRTAGSGRALGEELAGFTGTGEVPQSPYRSAFQFVQRIAERFAASLPRGL